jgi:hypothetical protein
LPPLAGGVYTDLPFESRACERDGARGCGRRGPAGRAEENQPMRLYPKVIPTIAREVIQTLMQDGDVEIETLRISDAEMDMAAIMKEYLAAEERVNAATREALERRGYDHAKFNQVKREMADVRGFKMGDEGIEYVIGQMIEFLLISRNVEEVYAEDTTIRKKVFGIFKKHLDVDEEIDREARARLKHLQEGTSAWEVEYQKTVDLLRRSRGLI